MSERRGVPHHLLDMCDVSEEYTAGRFHDEGRAVIREIVAVSDIAVFTHTHTQTHKNTHTHTHTYTHTHGFTNQKELSCVCMYARVCVCMCVPDCSGDVCP